MPRDQPRHDRRLAVERHEDRVHRQVALVERGDLLGGDLDLVVVAERRVGEPELVERRRRGRRGCDSAIESDQRRHRLEDQADRKISASAMKKPFCGAGQRRGWRDSSGKRVEQLGARRRSTYSPPWTRCSSSSIELRGGEEAAQLEVRVLAQRGDRVLVEDVGDREVQRGVVDARSARRAGGGRPARGSARAPPGRGRTRRGRRAAAGTARRGCATSSGSWTIRRVHEDVAEAAAGALLLLERLGAPARRWPARGRRAGRRCGSG